MEHVVGKAGCLSAEPQAAFGRGWPARGGREAALGRLRWMAGALILAGCLTAWAGGCAPVNDKVLTDEEGNQIRLAQIIEIVTNEDLTDTQKRQWLEDLGVTDEGLLNVFLRET